MGHSLQRISKEWLEENIDALIDIDRDTIGETWNQDHYLAEVPGKWECSWVAIGDDGPAGFVVASDKGASIHVHRIAVASSKRGEGIGRLLLERATLSAEERGVDRITLRVAAENTGAIRFYRRLGFAAEDPKAKLLNLSVPADALRRHLQGLHHSADPPKAKVLFVCAADISAANLLAPQIKALEDAAFEVHIACSAGSYADSLREQGFKIRPLSITNRASPVQNLGSIVSLYRLIRQERYTVVHVHMISAAFLGRIAAGLARVPLVFYTFRGFAFYDGSARRLRWFNLAIEKACRPLTDFYFSQSEENRVRAIRHGVMPAERSMLLGNGIKLTEFTSRLETDDRQAIRRELQIDPDAVVVGFVGRLVREKGLFEFVDAAVEAVRAEDKAIFLIVGEALSTDVDSVEGLRARIAQLGIESRFRFTGWRSDVARLYQAMDIFVLPSYREGMPRSSMEAMASGKPVVATDIAGCRDQVVQGETGFLVPLRDAPALASAVTLLLRDPDLRKKMGEAGRKRALEQFDERVVCARLVAQYKKLLPAAAHRTPAGTKRLSLGLKRAFDCSAALLCLIVFLPAFFLIALAIKMDSEGPVFYRQTREGKDRKPFRIFKFRTMTRDAEKFGLEIQKDDARITRVGKVLRQLSLDELPQLLNVLRGEMSLVGPRPLLPGTTRPEEERRLSMRPGITSYPALFGRHALQWEDRMPIDLSYVDNWSWKLDLKILARTIPIVLAAENVYDPEGGSRMRPTGIEMTVNGMPDNQS